MMIKTLNLFIYKYCCCLLPFLVLSGKMWLLVLIKIVYSNLIVADHR